MSCFLPSPALPPRYPLETYRFSMWPCSSRRQSFLLPVSTLFSPLCVLFCAFRPPIVSIPCRSLIPLVHIWREMHYVCTCSHRSAELHQHRPRILVLFLRQCEPTPAHRGIRRCAAYNPGAPRYRTYKQAGCCRHVLQHQGVIALYSSGLGSQAFNDKNQHVYLCGDLSWGHWDGGMQGGCPQATREGGSTLSLFLFVAVVTSL